MPRRVTKTEKQIFADFVKDHPHIEKHGPSQEEYEEICTNLNWKPASIKKQKCVNIANVNSLLLDYKKNKNQNMDANDHLEEQLCMNEDYLCCVCVARQTWSGKRIYKFANYTYQKQSYVVKFTQDEWTQFSTLDSKGKYMLSKGYAGIVTREMRKSDCSCKVRLKKILFTIVQNFMGLGGCI